MSDTGFLSSVNRAFSEVRAWKTATFVLAAVCCFIAWQLTRVVVNQPMVLVPYDMATAKGNVSVQVNGEIRGTSSEYLANVALSDLALITNFTPDNVLTTYRRFLNRLTEPLYQKQESKLLAQAAEYKSRGVTQSFFPVDVKTTADGKQMVVRGTLVQAIGGKETNRTQMAYVVSYEVYRGYLHLSDLRQQQ